MLSSAARSLPARSARILQYAHNLKIAKCSVPSVHSGIARQARNSSTVPAYEDHIPLNWFENAFLAVGSGIVLLRDPYRAGSSLIYAGFMIQMLSVQ